MSKKQDLNSLSRFRKDSGRLILEEYNSCEAPAGCAGVVLRWRAPRAEWSYVIYCSQSAGATWLLDGIELCNSRVDIASGGHVVACVLTSVKAPRRAAGLICFAAVYDPLRSKRDSAEMPAPGKLVSRGDDTWQYTLDEPPDGWATIGFITGRWPTLVERPPPQIDGPAWTYQAEVCQRLGAACLGLPPTAPKANRVWVRKAFTITDPVA